MIIKNILIILLINILFINSIISIGVDKLLKDNFNNNLFVNDQLEKQIKINHLININNNNNIYSDLYETFNNNYNVNSNSESSESSQNTWIGETCQQTTFNWSRTSTSCLNDCYEIWGQGKCNQVTNQCECNFFYTGEDCSINIDTDHNWDEMECNGGRYCPPIYNTSQRRRCYCPPGQEGLECNICTTSSGCNSLMNDQLNTYTCDNSPYVNTQKSYSCIVTSSEINQDLNNSTASTIFNCNFDSNQNSNGSCSMNLYYSSTGTPLYFNCSFNECVRTISNGIQSIACSNSLCNCTTYCGFFLAGAISDVSGPALFECATSTSSSYPVNCTFTQQELSLMLPPITLSCNAGECLSSSTPSPSPLPLLETCQQTTFNWSRTSTSCLNDCYEIWGQGKCNQVTNQCECSDYYMGEDCSVNIDQNFDWDEMECNGGRYCPPFYNATQTRHCYCPPGQEGLECNICTTSSGCNSIMNDQLNTYTCDSSHIVYNQKNYSCLISNTEVNNIFEGGNMSTSYSCSFENNQYNNQSGECSLNMYYSLTGTPLYFSCLFYECDREVSNGNQTISCQRSECSCTTYCSSIIKAFISQVRNPAKFSCSQSSLNSNYQTNCLFSQVEFSELVPNFELDCNSSECLNNNLPII